MRHLFLKKPIQQAIQEANDPNIKEGHGQTLSRSLTATNLTALGIGGIIGAGIFSLTGAAAANYAGPAIVYSFIIGGILCALAGLCYAEMAAMVPVAGSAYAYSYSTMGELIAWIIGWDLVLEYAFGAVTVAVAWSGYLYSLMHKTLGIDFPDWAIRLTKCPWEMVTLADGTQVSGLWNVPASIIPLIVGMILYRGIKESAWVNNLIVVVKVTIIVAFIILGWDVVNSANWIANANVTGFMSLVPSPEMVMRHGHEVMAYGLPGVLTGAGVVFFAYIGFDAVSTTAQEAKNPDRDLPIGILASLVICTILYILMALVLTGVVPYKELGVPDPVAVGIDRIVQLRGWSGGAQLTFTFLVKLGALAGLTSVILVLTLGQTRIFYAMAKDGLLPWFSSVHKDYKTPHVATAMTAVFVAFCGGLMPMTLVGELVSIGTLLAFVLVCVGVVVLRVTEPNIRRPFRTPAYWLVGPLGAVACMWVMSGLPVETWERLIIWLAIGFVVYFGYGRKHSRLRQKAESARSGQTPSF
jgi:basic amino acid/polyamine antiporter, APA family